jgi:hypothetical protein
VNLSVGDVDLDELAARQVTVANDRWRADRELSEQFLLHYHRLQGSITDQQVRDSLLQQRLSFRPTTPELPGSLDRPGCTSTTVVPPFPVGLPSPQQSGADGFIDDVGVLPAPLAPSAQGDFPTFTQQAFAQDGQVRLSVALGRLPLAGSLRVIYPAEREVAAALFIETTDAHAELAFLSGVPSSPTPSDVVLRIVVNVSIGSRGFPYYLLVPPDAGSNAGISTQGSAHVILRSSLGDESDSRMPFLQHHVLGAADWQEVPPASTLALQGSLTLSTGVTWVYVGITVGAWAQHYWLGLPPPERPRDRSGFIGVDLREPPPGLPDDGAVGPILWPGGPVTVTRVQLEFCSPDPIFAPT